MKPSLYGTVTRGYCAWRVMTFGVLAALRCSKWPSTSDWRGLWNLGVLLGWGELLSARGWLRSTGCPWVLEYVASPPCSLNHPWRACLVSSTVRAALPLAAPVGVPTLLKANGRASLMAQWLRMHLPRQGTQARSLVQEDPTCCGAAKLQEPQLLSPGAYSVSPQRDALAQQLE